MTVSNKTILLVALSEGFALAGLLAAKLDKLIGNLTDVDVILVQDGRSIAQRYFDAKELPTRVERVTTRMQARSLAAQCTHAIVFWGGDDLADIVYFAKLLRKHLRLVTVPITSVRNRKHEQFDIYIGRGSKWGNPFEISQGPNGMGRDEVIEKFKDYFEREILPDPDKHSLLLSLRGYRLGCYCKPERCHGDIIAEYLNSYGDDAKHDGAQE